MSDRGALTSRPFVFVGPQGLAYVGLHNNEADCWRVALGWPDDAEIAAAKARGFCVYEATVSWQKPTTPPSGQAAEEKT